MSKRLNKIYGNCRVYHPNGELMFLCLEKRAKWYLNRNLATIITDEPLTIKLTFEPKGKGNIEYYLEEKHNACVVCNEKHLEILTKHHVVPFEYRKYFPINKKSRSSHDIVIICIKHHHEYETAFAQKLKKKIESGFGIIRKSILNDRVKSKKVYGFASIMLDPIKN